MNASNGEPDSWGNRAKRVTFGPGLELTASTLDRLRLDLALLGRAIFSHGPGERSNRISDALAVHARTLRKLLTALHALPKEAWPFLLFEESQATLATIKDLRNRFETGIQLSKDEARQNGHAAGGPTKDDRLRKLVIGLAHLYRTYFHVEPTHIGTMNETTRPSCFDEFARKAYSALLPHEESPKWDALNEAIGEFICPTTGATDPEMN